MMLTVLLMLSFTLAVNCETITVSSAGDLKNALNSVNPGDVIQLQDGYYSDTFETTRSGSPGNPITLRGSRGAVLSGPNYGFFLKANWWVLQGFSVTDVNKGIVVEGGSNNVLEDLDVGNIQDEGIHFRYGSSDNIVQNSYIHDTGVGTPGYGEGVYLGQAVSNWRDGVQDQSDRNQVLNNQIGPNVGAEAVDIKEGSCCGVVRGNTFDGHGQSGEHYGDSWIDVKGDNYVIEDNTGTHPFKNGFEIHHQDAAGIGGCGNSIINNHCNDLPSGGQCVVNFSTDCSNTIENNN